MLRLMLLLVGTPAARRIWWLLVSGGVLLQIAGVALFVDALNGVIYFPLRAFGVALVVVGVATAFGVIGAEGVRRRLRSGRAVALFFLGSLVVARPVVNDLVIALVFALVYAIDGLFRLAAAAVLRFRGWGVSMALGVGEVIFAALMLEPYPTRYAATVPACLALAIFLLGFGALRLGVRLRSHRSGETLGYLFSRSGADVDDVTLAAECSTDTVELGEVIVHVWTPTGAIRGTERGILVDRYVAAVDEGGVVSTGHASLEAGDVYISHYPGVELDRDPSNFAEALRSTIENDVPARFLPSYASESAGWCPSTMQVRFDGLDVGRLRAFFARYRMRDVYNLTRRNCSTTTVLALEVALEGKIVRDELSFRQVLRMLMAPELWVASQIRARAEAMTWTPGLALDYARALFGVLREVSAGPSTVLERTRRREAAAKVLERADAEARARTEEARERFSQRPSQLHREAAASGARAWSIVAVTLTAAVFGLAYGLSAPLLAESLSRSGRGSLFVGLCAAMHAVGVLGVAPLLPRLSARFGARRLIVGALVATAACLPLFPLAPSVWLWFPLRLVLGVAAEILLVASEAWANEASSPETRGRTMAIYTGALSLGLAGGPAILSVVGLSTLAYLVGAGLALVAVLPMFHPKVAPPEGSSHAVASTLFYVRAAKLAMVAAMLNAAVETAGLSFMPGYAMRLGFSEAGAFRLVSTLLVGALVLQLPVGYLADKVRPRTLSLVLAALAAVGAAAWPFLLAHHALAYVVVFVWGGVFVGMYTVMLTEVGSRFEGPDLVGVYSVMSVFWGLGALAGPSLVGGAVLASPAYGLPLAVAAGCALFFVAALAFDAPAPRAKG